MPQPPTEQPSGLSVDNATSKLERIRAARRACAQNLNSAASTAGAASSASTAGAASSAASAFAANAYSSEPPAAVSAAASSSSITPELTSEMTGWPCSGCTYINVESASTCALCSAPRDGWPDDSGDTPDDRSWPCAVCTFANSSDHAACEICGHQRGDGDSPYTPGGGGWACTACTLENTESAASCAVCGADRPGGSPHHHPRVGSVSELTEGLSPSEAKLVEAALKLKLKDLAD